MMWLTLLDASEEFIRTRRIVNQGLWSKHFILNLDMKLKQKKNTGSITMFCSLDIANENYPLQKTKSNLSANNLMLMI